MAAPPKLVNTISAHPKKSYCCALAGQCFWCILFLVLAIGVSGFLPFSTDVPLYLRDHRTRERQDAVREGESVADAAPALPAVELAHSVLLATSDDFLGQELELEILYTSQTGDIFAVDQLQRILDIERRIWSHPEYRNYCARQYTAEDIAQSNAANVTYITEVNDANDRPCAAPSSALWFCDPTTGVPCSELAASPPGLLECTDTVNGCSSPDDPDVRPLSNDFIQSKVKYFANTNPFDPDLPAANASAATLFYVLPDSSFGSSGLSSGRALRSVFRFAIPLPGFTNSQDRPDEQEEQIADFLFDALHDDLFKASSRQLEVSYAGFGVLDRYLTQVLAVDGSFLILSFLFVVCFMALMTRSWFVAANGLLHIFFAIPPAYFLYFGVFRIEYFGVFQILALYIITGIGADGVFFLWDSWELSEAEAKLEDPTKEGVELFPLRLWVTLKETALAVGVTSLTTLASFLANSTSSFPAISAFGLYAAALVLVNYFSLLIYILTSVAAYYVSFNTKPFCCGLTRKLSKLTTKPYHPDLAEWTLRNLKNQLHFGNKDKPTDPAATIVKPKSGVSGGSVEQPTAETKAEEPSGGASSDRKVNDTASASSPSSGPTPGSPTTAEPGATKQPHEGIADTRKAPDGQARIPAFYEHTWTPFLFRFKYLLLFVCLGIFIFFFTMMTTLEVDPNPPSFFPDDNPLQRFATVKAFNFARGPSSFAIDVNIVYGLDVNKPINRDGTNAFDATDPGKPSFDANFQIAPASQCMLHICNQAEQRDENLGSGGLPLFPIVCVMQDFYAYVITAGHTSAAEEAYTGVNSGLSGTALWNAITGPSVIDDTVNAERYFELFTEWLLTTAADGSSPYDEFNEYIRAERLSDTEIVLRFVATLLELNVDFTINFQDGILLFERWEAWLQDRLQDDQCAAVTANTPAFIMSETMGFFYVQESLVIEAFQGIGISLLLAFIVLTVFTLNWIVALYAVLTITIIVICVIGTTPLLDLKLGIIESILFVMVPGLSVDFVAHFANHYAKSHHVSRVARVRETLTEVGSSVLSGAISTIGSVSFLALATIVFFNRFGTFIAITIAYSLFWANVFFPCLLMSPLGPQGETGKILPLLKRCKRSCSKASTASTDPKTV